MMLWSLDATGTLGAVDDIPMTSSSINASVNASPRAGRCQVRVARGVVRDVPLSDVRVELFDGAVAWRKFGRRRGQKNLSGAYWASTTGTLVGFESRLELAVLVMLDYEHQVSRLWSQPCRVVGNDANGRREGTPDYLAVLTDGSLRFVEAKPAQRLEEEEVRAQLEWMGRVLGAQGWAYEVRSEPDPVVSANVAFLSGYRRSHQFRVSEVAAVADSAQGAFCLGEVVERGGRAIGDIRVARAIVLHLLWTHLLTTDLTVPLSNAAVVTSA